LTSGMPPNDVLRENQGCMYELNSQREASGLERLLKSFEDLLKRSEYLSRGGRQFTIAMSELYAVMTAFRIQSFIGLPDQIAIRATGDRQHTRDHPEPRRRLPEHVVFQNAARVLLSAISREDKAGMLRGLEEMGVLDLCPTSQAPFSRMELLAGSVSGRSQVIPFMELSLFAAEMGDYRRAGQYALQARAIGPGSWEIYNLCMVEGLIALDSANVGEAIQCLSRSSAACQTDEHASIACGVSAPNLSLAEKLLERGERVEVLMHLSQCKNVWQILRPQIDEWIGIIEKGEKAEFQASDGLRALNEPAYRLLMHHMRAREFEEGIREARQGSVPQKSPSAVLAARAKMQAEFRRDMNSAIEEKLETWWRGSEDTPGPGDKGPPQ
jgi:hypothetical protein